MSHQMENCFVLFFFSLSPPVSCLMSLFLNLGGWLAHRRVGVTSAASVIAEGNTALFLSAPLLMRPVHFSREVMRVCRVSQMPDVFACPPPHSLPNPRTPYPSLWFLHGRRLSIRASGLQEPKHSSVSVLPREVQPCLGRCICSPRGASRGKSVNPGAPCVLVSLEGLLGTVVSAEVNLRHVSSLWSVQRHFNHFVQ